MKNILLFRKPKGLLFLSFAFLFLLNTQLSRRQQVIGNFPAMNGGFEGATIDRHKLTNGQKIMLELP